MALIVIIVGVESSQRDFMPALRFSSLTRLFDPVVAIGTRERDFKRRVLREAAPRPGERVLDLGCGTGTLALMARDEEPGIDVVGLDADPEILRTARSKAESAAAPIELIEGMSTELPFADGEFDVVLSTLFFHHLRDADKRATAVEIARVLKPDGRVVVGDLGRPQDPVMRVTAALTVQLLDGRTTTQLNVDGRLPTVFETSGFGHVAVVDRMRTPAGTLEILTATR